MKAMNSSGRGGDVKTRLQSFLGTYRFSPHATTGKSPYEMMFGRKARTRLDMLRPNVKADSMDKLDQESTRQFDIGDSVWIKDYRSGKWLAGMVVQKIGSVTYNVVVNGLSCRRHINRLRRRVSDDYYIPTTLPQADQKEVKQRSGNPLEDEEYEGFGEAEGGQPKTPKKTSPKKTRSSLRVPKPVKKLTYKKLGSPSDEYLVWMDVRQLSGES